MAPVRGRIRSGDQVSRLLRTKVPSGGDPGWLRPRELPPENHLLRGTHLKTHGEPKAGGGGGHLQCVS